MTLYLSLQHKIYGIENSHFFTWFARKAIQNYLEKMKEYEDVISDPECIKDITTISICGYSYLQHDIEDLAAKTGHFSRSEFIRCAIRDHIIEIEKNKKESLKPIINESKNDEEITLDGKKFKIIRRLE